LYADNTSLDVAAYSFDTKMRELLMQLIRIDDGEYKISIYEDLSGEGKAGDLIWQTIENIKRFDIVNVPIPPKIPVVIKVEQLSSYMQAKELADLAIDPWDVIFDNERITCVIHNLGNSAAEA